MDWDRRVDQCTQFFVGHSQKYDYFYLKQSKMDVMNLDTQLMEAIHKKIELSQQLERWEIDLETLIEMQVRHSCC